MANPAFQGTVGYIGLGDMGGGIARRLVTTGHDVVVFDLKAEAVAALVERGARSTESLRELVTLCSVVVICVDPEPSVPKVVEALLEYLRPGQVVIVQSTVRPDVIIACAADAAAKGVSLFDAPVSGSYDDRINGTLSVPTGARRDEIGDVAALLETIGRPVYLGILGGGVVAKLANNAVSSVTRASIMEAIRLGEAYGIAEADLLEVFKLSSANSFVAANWAFFDQLARAGHIIAKQPNQAAEMVAMMRHLELSLPVIESHFEPLRVLDRERFSRLTGRDPD